MARVPTPTWQIYTRVRDRIYQSHGHSGKARLAAGFRATPRRRLSGIRAAIGSSAGFTSGISLCFNYHLASFCQKFPSQNRIP
jgi:hypothetical protein